VDMIYINAYLKHLAFNVTATQTR